MEASVVVCSALRPPYPCHPENTQQFQRWAANKACTVHRVRVFLSYSFSLDSIPPPLPGVDVRVSPVEYCCGCQSDCGGCRPSLIYGQDMILTQLFWWGDCKNRFLAKTIFPDIYIKFYCLNQGTSKRGEGCRGWKTI